MIAQDTVNRCVEMVSAGGSALDSGIGLDRGVSRDDIDESATEAYLAGRDRKQGVIPATANQISGLEPRATLADDDRPRSGRLAAKQLDAAVLRVGVSAILA